MARARIFRPAKNAMQSGRAQLRKWVLEYEPVTPRRPDPLMGWATAEDTLDQVSLRFATLDEAIAFARTLIRDALATPRSPGLQQ